MSATAGRGAERRMEERASAAEKAWSDDCVVVVLFSEAEHWIEKEVGGFNDLGLFSFGFKMVLERLVGIVRDIVF